MVFVEMILSHGVDGRINYSNWNIPLEARGLRMAVLSTPPPGEVPLSDSAGPVLPIQED